MTRLSLRTRVVASSVIALAVALAAISLAINWLLAGRLDQDAAAALRERTDAQLATVDSRGGRAVVHEGPHDEALDRRAWVFASGRAIERANVDPATERAAAGLAGVTSTTERDVPGSDVRLRAVPAYARGGGPQIATVVVGLSLTPYLHTRRIALLGTLALDALVLLVGAVIASRAAGAGLRPVAEMADHAEDWSEHDLDRRFDRGPPRDELTALAATLDGLLARIAASRRHEQHFSAEMAHELRTPLSGMRGEAELALRPGRTPAEMRDALQRVIHGSDRMAGVIETLLTVARRELDDGLGTSDAVACARAALDVVRPAADRRGIPLDLRVPGRPVEAGADGDVIVQALHPLLDNALRHARSAIHVEVAEEGERVKIEVRDDGAGVCADEVEEIFIPGNGNGNGSAGLGLALARRLAQTCGGDVTARASPAGGRFVVDLPAAARPRPAARRPATEPN